MLPESLREFRVWTDVFGREITAKLSSVDLPKGIVVLRKRGGYGYIAWSSLSVEDRRFVEFGLRLKSVTKSKVSSAELKESSTVTV